MAATPNTTCTRKRKALHVSPLPSSKETKKVRRLQTGKTIFDLPRELRDLIYDLSLVSTETIDISRFATSSSGLADCELGISAALLRASRQVYHEARDVLYGLNTFQATVLLDPRVSHHFQRRVPSANHYDRNGFTHPMISMVRRLVIRLEFCVLSRWPGQDVSFPEAVLRAFILGGSPDLVIIQPDCCVAYLDTMRQLNATLAVANTALAAKRGTLFTTHLLHYWSHNKRLGDATLAICCPQTASTFEFLEFPWNRSAGYPTDGIVDVTYRIPRKFGLTGQMRLLLKSLL